MKSYTMNENYIAKAEQQTFTLQKPFANGTVQVYLNASATPLTIEQDYIELPDAGQVTINGIKEGDIISVQRGYEDSAISEVISSGYTDKPNSIFKKYTSVPKLKFNNKYEINVSLGGETFKWNFNTRMTPLFSTVKKVLEDIGEFVQGFTEEYIQSMIHRNSIELMDLVKELAEGEEQIQNITITKDADGVYVSAQKAVGNWVRYKTELELIYARYYGISYRYGSVSKAIGDIDIEKTTDLPEIDALLKRVKDQFQNADNIVKNNGYNFVGSAVKGANRFEYNERGSF